MCLIASSRGESMVVPLWAHEAVIMHPTKPPKAEVWATIALHVESTNGETGQFTLLHPGKISEPTDRSKSLLGKEDDWVNHCINRTEGRKVEINKKHNSLNLAHEIKGVLPFTLWGELKYALGPVYPLSLGSSKGAALSIWPDSAVLAELKQRKLQPSFTEIVVTVPRQKGKELRICRLRFETTNGIKSAGVPGQYLYTAYGPNEMVREVRQALFNELPDNLREPFLKRYRQATSAFRPIQYDVTMIGRPAGHTYIVDWGDEHRLTPMFTIPDPDAPDRTCQVFSFTPRDLNFRLQMVAVPAALNV